MLDEAGHGDTEIELISLDGDWRMVTTDAIAGQLRDAGFNIKRTVIPGSTFWNDWTKYPSPQPTGAVALLVFRSTLWPIVRVRPGTNPATRTPSFDALLAEALGIFDADARREVMAKMSAMLQDSGAVIQPFWMGEYAHHTDEVMDYQKHQFREMHFEKVWLDA